MFMRALPSALVTCNVTNSGCSIVLLLIALASISLSRFGRAVEDRQEIAEEKVVVDER
jgi:hypothetical protein